MASKTLSLTPAETLFRQCLIDCRNTMSSDTPGMKDLVLRWTGGWVRDKLLGVPSNDIDVALSTMTGMQFGQALQSFMKDHGSKYEDEAKKQGFKAELKNLHKIAANPEKSKHLETITTRMFGIEVDFVNLRKEVYDDNSRNPQMEFGTAEEDALRRDATVNALFYNLDSESVEDFTERGLDDMEKKIIRTPLAPYQTFKDDPLRVLRLIRFASRLGYTIEESAQEAMKDETIHEALRLKISRERVGVEVGKILAGPDPYTGLSNINEFGLYDTVFADPKEYAPDPRNALRAQQVYSALQLLLDNQSAICDALKLKEDLSLTWFLAAYVPWCGSRGNRAYMASREGIKATNARSKILDDAIKARRAIHDAMDSVVVRGKATRGQIGMVLRASKEAWRSHVLYALLCDILTRQRFHLVVNNYQEFLGFIQEHELEDAASIGKELVLKGNEIKDVLGVEKQGPWIKSAVDMVAEWQFNQRSNATREGAIEMIKERKNLLGLG